MTWKLHKDQKQNKTKQTHKKTDLKILIKAKSTEKQKGRQTFRYKALLYHLTLLNSFLWGDGLNGEWKS